MIRNFRLDFRQLFKQGFIPFLFCLGFLITTGHSTKSLGNALTINNVFNASNFTLGTGTENTVIFGGTAGDIADCDVVSATATCNNCTNPNLHCNRNRIHPGLRLQINFTVRADVSGNLWFGHGTGGDSTLSEFASYTNRGNSLSQNSQSFVEIDWLQVCDAIGAGTDCNTSSINKNLFIGLVPSDSGSGVPSSSQRTRIVTSVHRPSGGGVNFLSCDAPPSDGNVGVCYFDAFPGDEKATIREIDIVGNLKAPTGLNLVALRVFYRTDNVFPDYTTPTFQDLPINSEGEVRPNRVENLTNDEVHIFSAAVVDQANNIAFMNNAVTATNPVVPAECAGPFIGNPGNVAACGLVTVPSLVFGLLPDDLNCFISTATYGSPLSAKVEDFRQFRNQYLLTHKPGQILTHYYYKLSPPLAKYISERPWAQKLSQVALFPFWLFASLSLLVGPLFSFIILQLILLLTISAPVVLLIFSSKLKHRLAGTSS